MSGIAVEIRGEGCDRVAQDLRSRIARVSGGETSIEVERGVDPVAVVGMLFAGVQTAEDDLGLVADSSPQLGHGQSNLWRWAGP